MRKALIFSITICGFLFLSSCEKVAFEPVVVEGQVSFATDVAPVMHADCAGCHKTIFGEQANFYKNLATKGYIDTVNATSSKVYKKLSTDAAHQGHTSPDNLAKILKWFEQGAKNN